MALGPLLNTEQLEILKQPAKRSEHHDTLMTRARELELNINASPLGSALPSDSANGNALVHVTCLMLLLKGHRVRLKALLDLPHKLRLAQVE